MTYALSTAARRTVLSTLAALVLATALPEAGYAQSSPYAGTWKVNVAKSKLSPGSNFLNIAREGTGVNPGAGSFLVISDGNVYRATRPSGSGIEKVDHTNWKGMDLVQIGTNAQVVSSCSIRCQLYGAPGRHMTVSFQAVDTSGRKTGEFVAMSRE